MPHPWLFVLVPLGFMGLRDVRSAVLLLFLPLSVSVYTFYYWLPVHYIMMLAPAAIAALLLAIRELAGPRWTPFAVVALAALCVGQLPQLTGQSDESISNDDELLSAESRLHEVTPPALVLIRYSAGLDPHAELVYQRDWPTPHDAPVVRAQALGPEFNRRLLDYYAEHDPDRIVWVYDRSTRAMMRLGSAGEIARQSGGDAPPRTR